MNTSIKKPTGGESGIKKLPAELWSEILGYLGRLGVYNYLYVNKMWNQTAVPLFYEKIQLSGKTIKRLKDDGVSGFAGISKYGHFIKKLIFDMIEQTLLYLEGTILSTTIPEEAT